MHNKTPTRERAREVCANIAPGEIVVFDNVFDKAYVDFEHLTDLAKRGIWWVTRAKDNMAFREVVNNHTKSHEIIIKDLFIALMDKLEGMPMRRVEVRVEVDGK